MMPRPTMMPERFGNSASSAFSWAGAPASKEELRGYLDELYHGYTEAFGMASCAVSRMKAHWHYLIQRFEGSEAFEKQLRKAREGWEYETVVNQIFACWPK